MSEKVKFDQLIKNNQKKNISKAKSLTQKSKIIRNAHTPIKAQSTNKIYINNNSNTMINPNNNYNINNNISININIDMTNERNKSFNLKNKSQSKKPPINIKKMQYSINNNSLIYNTLKNFANKSSLKKSPFHIRIKSSNYGFKEFKCKPSDNPRNKVYQNRLNYYYNISNKNNFNIFSHKFEAKKPESNSNITDIDNKNTTLNHTPIIQKTNKIYKNLKENPNKKKQNIFSITITDEHNMKKNNNVNINNNKNTNSKKYIKRNVFSPINKEPLNKKKNKNISTTPNHSNNQLNRSIDNRKMNQKNSNSKPNLKIDKINYRNISSSPFTHSKKIINNTINYDNKNKNKENKNLNIYKSPVNYKFSITIFKNKNNLNAHGKNFRSPVINNKNVSKLNKINKSVVEKDKNKKNKENNKNLKEKEEYKEDIIKVNKEVSKPIQVEKEKVLEKEEEPEKKLEKEEIVQNEEENPPQENKEKESSIQINKEEKEKEKPDNINEKKEELKEEEKKVEPDINTEKEKNNVLQPPKSESDIAQLFLNDLFQNSFPVEKHSSLSDPNKRIVSHIESICKIGYAGPGIKKKNQDNFFIYKNFLNDNDTIFLGVCDGHGMFGHDISTYLVNMLPQNLQSDLTKEDIISIKKDDDFQKISNITTNTFVQTNINLVSKASIDCTYSGSTCTSLIFSPEKIISVNVGDSRCVLGKCINDKWTAKNLTRDHKPTEEDEKKRILEKGGRIEPYKDENGEAMGPERVWLKGEDLPGLAMSRSFGDDVAHMIGVTSKPEIMEFKLSEEDKFVMLASDGIFEFISSDEAVNMVKDYYLKDDINGALNYLYKTSSQRWIMEEEVIDDITLIIMFLK